MCGHGGGNNSNIRIHLFMKRIMNFMGFMGFMGFIEVLNCGILWELWDYGSIEWPD